MPNTTEHPLNRKYRHTAFDRRQKPMKVYDFTRPMTPAERISLFATVRHAIHRVMENHNRQFTVSELQTRHTSSQQEKWWQYLRSNRQRYKRIL